MLDNVNYLVNRQKELNTEYLADVLLVKVPKDASKDNEQEIDKYNEFLKEERKSETPPIYEPLLLNCDLLFMLASDLDVGDKEKAKVDGILHGNGEELFLIPAVDDRYWFVHPVETEEPRDVEVEFRGDELSIPTEYASTESVIKVTVSNTESDVPSVYEDWILQRVDRKIKGDISTFTTTYQSPSAKNHEFADGTTVEVEIMPKDGISTNSYKFSFVAERKKTDWWEVVKVWEKDLVFNRVQ